MQSAKKVKILSALSMAAAATIAAKSAHGATLTMFYGQDTSYANSNNNVQVGSTWHPTGATLATGSHDATGGFFYVTNGTSQPSLVTVNQNAPTTINLPVGSYLSFAVDAVLTGNSNADGGKLTGNKGATHAQPSFLGLSLLSVGVNSTDATGALLQPVNPSTNPFGVANGKPTFLSSAVVNANPPQGTTNGLGANGGAAANANSVVPIWSATAAADVQPNNGNMGLNGFTTGGTQTLAATSAAAAQQLGQFAASTNVASYNAATDFADSMIFQGVSKGTVTLSPTVVASASQYWTLTTPGSGNAPSVYTPETFGTNSSAGGAADVINQLPVLVINVGGTTGTTTTPPPTHAVVALSATAGANYGTTVGALHITGSAAAGYTHDQVTGLTPAGGVGNVTAQVWNSAADQEIFGVDVTVNGAQASAAQLNTLLAAINGTDGGTPSTGLSASLTDPSAGQILTGLDTATTTYNLFLSFASGFAPSDDLGLDLSNTNDTHLVGYSFSAVSVVPEPASIGLLALGGIGLMSRRNRRKA